MHSGLSLGQMLPPGIWAQQDSHQCQYGGVDCSEGEVAVFSAKPWDCRSSRALIESGTLCYNAQVVGHLSPGHFLLSMQQSAHMTEFLLTGLDIY